MAAVDLPPPVAGRPADPPVVGDAVVVDAMVADALVVDAVVVDTGRGCALWICDAGLACCAVEVAAALSRLTSAPAPAGAAGLAEAARVNVFVVAGTVTDKLAPVVLAAYRQVPEPKLVLSFGACSNSGGPYWDSYCVTKGVDQFIPVDGYVPGCPPRPEALLAGLDLVLQRSLA